MSLDGVSAVVVFVQDLKSIDKSFYESKDGMNNSLKFVCQ